MSGGVVLLGAGAAGGSLALALAHSGVRFSGVHDLREEAALAVANRIGTPASHGEGLPAVLAESATVIVAVPDSAVTAVARLAVAEGRTAPGQVWLHLAGALPASALSPLGEVGCSVGALHPAVAFPPGRLSELPAGALFAVDGDAVARSRAEELARSLGAETVLVPARARAAYHAATVVASNHVVALLAEARQLLESQGLARTSAETLLTHLAQSAVDRVAEVGLADGLSGPVRRGDADTVRAHLEALDAHPGAAEHYRLLARAALRLAREAEDGRGEAALAEVAALLEGRARGGVG